MKCEHCGQTVRDQALFCKHCGNNTLAGEAAHGAHAAQEPGAQAQPQAAHGAHADQEPGTQAQPQAVHGAHADQEPATQAQPQAARGAHADQEPGAQAGDGEMLRVRKFRWGNAALAALVVAGAIFLLGSLRLVNRKPQGTYAVVGEFFSLPTIQYMAFSSDGTWDGMCGVDAAPSTAGDQYWGTAYYCANASRGTYTYEDGKGKIFVLFPSSGTISFTYDKETDSIITGRHTYTKDYDFVEVKSSMVDFGFSGY